MSSSRGLYGSDTGTNLMSTMLAEMIGTFLLVYVGIKVAVSAILKQPIAGSPADSLAVALTFGLMLVALATALGPISGCHLNPAVTFGLAVTGQFPWLYVVPYMVAQFVGATLASLVLWLEKGDIARSVASLGATQPAAGVSDWRVLLIEATATFALMFIIVAVATNDRVPAAAAGLAIGATLFVAIMCAGPETGGAINPARALGPMLVSGKTDGWYLYIAGPAAGAVLAALVFKPVRKGEEPSEAEGD